MHRLAFTAALLAALPASAAEIWVTNEKDNLSLIHI